MPDDVSSAGRILVVDDDPDIRRAAAMLLERRCFGVVPANGPAEAWSGLAAGPVDAVLLDLNFGPGARTGAEGLQLLQALLDHQPGLPVIVVTGHSGIAIAVAAMRAGAADFVMKPWNNERLVATVTEAVGRGRARRAARTAPADQAESPLLGDSSEMRGVRDLVARASRTDAPVLLYGEPGTGKTLAAHTIHRLSAHRLAQRADAPLVTVDPGSVWSDGEAALAARIAAVPRGATLFLDEIAGLPAALQDRLAGVLADRPDLRLLAATRRTREAVTAGLVRADLLYRLNILEIILPPLRDRAGDVRLLAHQFLHRFSLLHGVSGLSLSGETADAVACCPWPGNVRALRQAMERAVLLATDGRLPVADLLLAGTIGEAAPAAAADPGGLNLARSEKSVIQAALTRHGFNVSQAARDLGLTRASLYRRMERHGL